MMTVEQEKRVAISIQEASVMSGVSEGTLYTLANDGKLPGCRRLGRRLVIHRAVFEEWLRSGTGDESEEMN